MHGSERRDDAAQFCNAATANCTTTITTHKNVGVAFPFDWRVIANGRLPELLYEHGVIDVSRPLAEVERTTLMNERAQAAGQDPPFSARIRDGEVRPPLLVLPAGVS